MKESGFFEQSGSAPVFLLGAIASMILMFAIGGPLRSIFLLGFFVFSGLVVLDKVLRDSSDPDEWIDMSGFEDITHLLMPSVKVYVRGALKGSEFSREKLESKLRGWFLSKVRSVREISSEELQNMMEEPDELKRFIGDEVITEFLLSDRTAFLYDVNGVSAMISSLIKDKGYERWLKNLIRRMEEWE